MSQISSNIAFFNEGVDDKLEISDSWDLPFRIVIDNNWTDTRDMYDWCYGSGTEFQPFVIENVKINGQGAGSCITVMNSNDYFRIQNCTVYNASSATDEAGIKFLNVMNGKIVNCNASANGLNGIYFYQSSNNQILNSIVNDNPSNGIWLYDSCNSNLFENNTFSNNHYYAIRFDISCDFNEILINEFVDNNVRVIDYCDNNTIKNNVWNNGGLSFTEYCANNSIADNTILEGGIGINHWCDDNTIVNNTISYGSATGIYIDNYCDNNKIVNNTISHKGDDGIEIGGDDNLVINNTCFNCSHIGIDVYGNRNNITQNILISNGIGWSGSGIRLHSDNHMAFLNIFKNNEHNGRNEGNNNQWDNGSIGNYWDDYNGTDWDDDGIGDSPYWIKGIGGFADDYDHFPIWCTEPNITIHSPESNSFWNTEPIINITAIDGTLQYVWYNVDAHNEFLESGVSEPLRTDIWNLLPEGFFEIKFWANDSLNNINDEVSCRVIKDTIPPSLNVLFPTNNTEFYDTYPKFEVSVSDDNLKSWWYTFNEDPEQHYGLDVKHSVWDSIPDGTVTIIFGASDMAGNTVYKTVIVTKVTTPESQARPIGSFEMPLLMLGFISISLLLILWYQKRLKKPY